MLDFLFFTLLLTANAWARTEAPGSLNLTVSQGHVRTDAGASGATPAEGRYELIQHYNFLSLESAGHLQDRNENVWEVGDTALVADFEWMPTRVRVGDSVPLTAGYLSAINSGGLHIFRPPNRDASRSGARRSSALIYIRHPVLLEMRAGDVLIARRRVGAGALNLRDFAGTVGRALVRVRLIDESGDEENFDVDLFFDGGPLTAGESEFSYLAGAPSASVGHQRMYISGALTSLLHRYGLTDDMTLGLNAQNFEEQRLLGFEARFFSSIGAWQADVARSSQTRGEGDAARLRYRSGALTDFAVRLTAEMEARSGDFGAVGFSPPAPPRFARRIESLVHGELSADLSAFGGGGSEWGRAGLDADARIFRGGLQWALHDEWRTDVHGSKTLRDSGVDEQWLVTLTWLPREWAAHVSRDTLARRDSQSLQRYAEPGSHQVDGEIRGDRDDVTRAAEARFRYRGSKLRAQAEYRSTKTDLSETDTTRAGVGTTLVWGENE